MRTFEYKIVTEQPNRQLFTLQSHFNELGRDGWELCGIVGLSFIFKRERSVLVQ